MPNEKSLTENVVLSEVVREEANSNSLKDSLKDTSKKNQTGSVMPDNHTNKPDTDETENNMVDIFCLINLQEELAKALKATSQIIERLDIDVATMNRLKNSLGSSPKIWDIDQAKEFLDVIIINAALGNVQLLKYKDLVVQVVNKNLIA